MISAFSKQHSCLVLSLSKCLNSLPKSTAFRNVSMVDIHFRKLLWVYCPGHAGEKENDRADRLAGIVSLTGGLLLGRSEVLRSLRHYLRAQSQKHHTIDRLEERGVERGSARRSSLKGCLLYTSPSPRDRHRSRMPSSA